jgi:hypothetical protein
VPGVIKISTCHNSEFIVLIIFCDFIKLFFARKNIMFICKKFAIFIEIFLTSHNFSSNSYKFLILKIMKRSISIILALYNVVAPHLGIGRHLFSQFLSHTKSDRRRQSTMRHRRREINLDENLSATMCDCYERFFDHFELF